MNERQIFDRFCRSSWKTWMQRFRWRIGCFFPSHWDQQLSLLFFSYFSLWNKGHSTEVAGSNPSLGTAALLDLQVLLNARRNFPSTVQLLSLKRPVLALHLSPTFSIFSYLDKTWHRTVLVWKFEDFFSSYLLFVICLEVVWIQSDAELFKPKIFCRCQKIFFFVL